MRVYHYKLLICGAPSFRALLSASRDLAWKPELQRGFVPSDGNTQNRFAGRYVYTRLEAREWLDRESLEPKKSSAEVLADCRFELDFSKGLVMVERSRGDFGPLFEALDAMPGVNVEFEDLNLNLLELMQELQGAYKRNVIKNLRIRDYLARENMLATAAFKIIEPQDGEKIADKYDDQLDAFTLTLKLPDGAANVSVTRKGTVRVSDAVPDELVLFVRDLLPRFHEAEVETAEVVGPHG